MFIMEAIPDIPEEIDIQLQRTEFIVRKLIDQVADDNEPNVSGTEKIVNFEKYPVGDGGFYQDNEGMFANMK